MKVSDKVTRSPRVASPDDAIREAAHAMAQPDAGVLPVGENGRLVGMVTDHDKRLVGILSLGDVAMGEGPRPAGDALSGVSRPGGEHSRTGGERTGPGA